MSTPPARPETRPPAATLLDSLLHTRPRSWPIVALHLAAGFLVATGIGSLQDPGAWTRLLTAAALWAIGLNGGTLALNSAIDRDAGDVGYLDNPPPPPPGLAATGIGLMLAGGAGAAVASRSGLLGAPFVWMYAACLVLSLLYSLPPVRLKARPGWDLMVNCLGYGGITFAAGWAATGRPLAGAAGWATAGFGLLFAALYPLTQIYQMEDDRRAGTPTLALRIGRSRCLWLATLAAAAALACLTAGWHARGGGAAGWFLLAAACAWGWVLLPLMGRVEPGDDKRAMYAALGAWAITDIAAVLALAP